MSIIDEVLADHESYVTEFDLGGLPMPPGRKLAIVACMDARLTIEPMLGLKTGDAHIIRNAGGIVTDDALRSLLISHYLLGTQEFMIINHTDCGMLTFRDEDLREAIHSATSSDAVSPVAFQAFSDVEENVRRQIEKLRSHPWVPQTVPVRGFVYDVTSGRLREVTARKARVA